MDNNLENSTQNRQDGPHKEGGSNNIASSGQTNPNNNTRGMSEMMNESGSASGDRQNRNATENEGSNSSDQELGGRH